MEELFVRIKCDNCKKTENQSMKHSVAPYLTWFRMKLKGTNKIVNLCSDKCLEEYVNKVIGD